MRTFTLFYSWQSDRPSNLCRNFIAEALKAAARSIFETRQIVVTIDADTLGVSGTPPISETILRKIDACDAFLADLTLVAATPDGKTSPNPNVLIEYGYALSAKGSARLILAMNTAYGGPQNLPFDLRHLRYPLQYEAEEDLGTAERRKRRARFAERLVVALNAVIDQAPARKRSASKQADPESLALKRMEEFKSSRAAFGTGAHVYRPRAVVDILPFTALARGRLDTRAVKAARPWFAPSAVSAVETSTHQGQWISREPPRPMDGLPNPMSRWSTRVVTPGHIECAFSLGGPVQFRFEQTIDGNGCDLLILGAIRRSGEICETIGLSGPALISLTIEGGEDLRLTQIEGQGTPLGVPHMAFGPVRVDDLRRPAAAQLRPLLDDLWQASGWEDGTSSISDAGWTDALDPVQNSMPYHNPPSLT